MPQTEVNLLPQEVQKERKKVRVIGSLNLVSLVFFVVAVISVVACFTYETIIIRQVAEVKKKERQMQEELTSLGEVELKIKTFETKAKGLSSVFSKRLFFSKLLSQVKDYLTSDVAITELFEVSPTEVNLSGTTSGYVALASFMKALVHEKDSIFEKVLGPTASTDRVSGQTKFTITLILKPDSLKKL